MAIFDVALGYFADFLLGNIGDFGYTLLLWLLNMLGLVQPT